MGMSTGGGDDGLMAEINVTPFVDVMLVLLIIFMVTAPMMTTGLEVQLPRAEAGALPTADEQVILGITADGRYSINETEKQAGELPGILRNMAQQKPDQAVFIKADGQVPYEKVAQLLATCTAAGITKVGMMTDPAGAPRAGG
jgi:biopolymer transport protein TolR